MKLVATCLFGLEKLLGSEIDALGLRRLETIDGRVTFEGEPADVARANINLRLAERIYILLGSFFLLSLAYVFYLELGSFPSETADELANLHSAMENAYKLIGSLLGLTVMYLLDHKLWKYETRAPWLAQILKLILGAVVVMGVKILLKSPLLALTGGHASAGAIRYFLMFAVGGACPGLFPYITRFSLFIMQKCKRTKA